MGTFTMPFKKYIEIAGGTLENNGSLWVLGGADIGLGDYPIFDPAYRDDLNSKIVAHYLNREIGMETPDMFRLALRRRLMEMMPYFNKLYLSEQIQYDPLSTIDLKTISSNTNLLENTNNGSSSALTDNASRSRAVNSNTPQTMLRGNGDYATSAVDSNGTSIAESSATEEAVFNSQGEGTAESSTTGYQGIASDLIMRYRAALMNVDLMVIESLEDCFMLVWDNSDDYTEGNYFV